MFNFAEKTSDMTAIEILNYYRNLYYAEPRVAERGTVKRRRLRDIKDIIIDTNMTNGKSKLKPRLTKSLQNF